jgi:hypothetical protein
MAKRSTKAVVGVLAVAGVAIGGGFGLHALWTTAKSHLSAQSTCTVGAYDLDTEQAAVASTMVGAVTKYRINLPERATVLVLAAGLQESKLRNLAPGEGDRDSVGVLQQRPSQGWGGGDAKKLNDVGEATKEFLDKLVAVPGWQTLPLAEAVQAVQISADGSLYAQHEAEAQALADALQGRTPAGISCKFDAPTKVATTASVAAQAGQQLGIDSPTASGPLTVRVPGARWQTVAWFVANADRLGIDEVTYAGRVWTRADGWKKSAAASSAAVVATMHDLSKKK